MVRISGNEIGPKHVFEIDHENFTRLLNDMDIENSHFEEIKYDIQALNDDNTVKNIDMALYCLIINDFSTRFLVFLDCTHEQTRHDDVQVKCQCQYDVKYPQLFIIRLDQHFT